MRAKLTSASDPMTSRERIWGIAGAGALAATLLAVGVDTLGGVLALVQLGFLVGGPTALLLGEALRSRAALPVLAATLSLAITAIAVQSLVWFDLGYRPLIVVTATAYGIGIAELLESVDRSGRGDPSEGLGGW